MLQLSAVKIQHRVTYYAWQPVMAALQYYLLTANQKCHIGLELCYVSWVHCFLVERTVIRLVLQNCSVVIENAAWTFWEQSPQVWLALPAWSAVGHISCWSLKAYTHRYNTIITKCITVIQQLPTNTSITTDWLQLESFFFPSWIRVGREFPIIQCF